MFSPKHVEESLPGTNFICATSVFFSQPNKFACCAGVETQPFLLRTMYISRAIGRVASNAFRAPAARIANKSFTAPVAVKGTSKSSPMNAIF